MALKDYYRTLQVQPTATTLQIKKSFRQLALRYHPDKNPGNAMAEAMYREIQEAYETLADPERREEYNYKRWYTRSMREPYAKELLDPAAILSACRRLNDYLHSVTAMRINFDGLSYQLRELLSDQNMSILKSFNDENANDQIIDSICRACSPLPFRYVEPITDRLYFIAGTDRSAVDRINRFVDMKKQQATWQRYRIPLVLIVTLFLCGIIYLLAR